MGIVKQQDIEKAFFKAFSFGGLMHLCFDWLQHKYDLGFYCSKEQEEKPKQSMTEKWQHYYDVTMPEEIYKLADAFDDSVIQYTESSLLDEISTNIDRLNGKEQERYIYSLLIPFKEYSDNLNPIEVIKQLRGEVDGIMGIKDTQKDLKMWENMPQDEQLYNVNGEPCGTVQEEVEACKHFIEEYKYRIERAEYKADKYREIANSITDIKEKTVEHCFGNLLQVVYMYATRLDALLLEKGINLMWYQKESGIYILTRRDITLLQEYCGSYKLARKYIDEALPQTEPQQITKIGVKNNSLSKLTKAEVEYYGKAVKSGMAEKTEDGYKWKYNNGSKASLAYFLNKIFNPDGTGQIPFKKLDVLWDVSRLDSALDKAISAKNPQQWRTDIDKLFTE